MFKTNKTSFIKAIESKSNLSHLRLARVTSKNKIQTKKGNLVSKTTTPNYPKFSYMCILVTVPYRVSGTTKKLMIPNKKKELLSRGKNKLRKTTKKDKKYIKNDKKVSKAAKSLQTTKTISKVTTQKLDQNMLLLLNRLLALLNKNSLIKSTTTKASKNVKKISVKSNPKAKKLKTNKQILKGKIKRKIPRVKKVLKQKPILTKKKIKNKNKKKIKVKIDRKTTRKKLKSNKKKTTLKKKKLIRVIIKGKKPTKLTTSKKVNKIKSKQKNQTQLSPDAQAVLLAKLLSFFDPRLHKMLKILNSPNTVTNAMKQKTIIAVKNGKPRPKSELQFQTFETTRRSDPIIREFKPLFSLERTPSVECGTRRKRLKNGKFRYNDYEWVVSIRSGCAIFSKHVCSGTLISNQHILTTASCIQHLRCARLLVGPDQEIHEIRRLILPSIYGQHTFIYDDLRHYAVRPDIAIIKLEKLTDLTPICLPGLEQFRFNVNSFKFVSFRDTNKQFVETILDRRSCFDGSSRIDLRSNKYFCIKHEPSSQINSELLCNQDEGGSLMFSLNGKWHLYGILFKRLSENKTNWLNPSCNSITKNSSSSYSIFTKAFDHIDWIRKSIN